jgi:hypothetical protein
LNEEDPRKFHEIELLSVIRNTIGPGYKSVIYVYGLDQENLSSIWKRQAAKLEMTCRSAANDCQKLIDITDA